MPLQNREQYNEYMNEYMKKRYFKRRAFWIEQLGGVCVDCHTTEELQFDHVNSSAKEVNIAKLLSSASEHIIEAEMVKCVLRCRPCHHLKSLKSRDYTGLR